MSSQVSNMARLALANNMIDWLADTFKICLMGPGFTFNPDTHEAWSDVSGYELSTANGYTQNNKTLATPTITLDTAIDRAKVVWASVSWAASGGEIGPTIGAIIHDPSISGSGSVVADPIIGYIDFGTALTQESGGSLTIAGIRVDI